MKTVPCRSIPESPARTSGRPRHSTLAPGATHPAPRELPSPHPVSPSVIMAEMEQSGIQVVVRLRPMSERELKGNTLPVVTASTAGAYTRSLFSST